jgi:diadenosine tetraphosphate (Ap4A) HIT family hydrolase
VSDCIFCRLLAGDGEVSVVHESERAVVFMDVQPLVRGHMLSVPRAHAPSLAELGPEDGAAVFEAARLATAALRASSLRCEGVNLFLADGEAAGQDVFHTHLHVVPRHAGDGFGLRLPPGHSIRPRSELDDAADALRQSWPST